jgi:hypothetical protein
MSQYHRRGARRWAVVVGRSLLVGASSGLLGGALIFFLFGFIGFSGASIPSRIENGWEAVIDIGLRKGLISGVGIAIGLVATILLWVTVSRRFDPLRARPWLSLLAILVVVLSNLEWLRNAAGWDDVGILTVLGIGLLVGAIVWAVTPWVLRDRVMPRAPI